MGRNDDILQQKKQSQNTTQVADRNAPEVRNQTAPALEAKHHGGELPMQSIPMVAESERANIGPHQPTAWSDPVPNPVDMNQDAIATGELHNLEVFPNLPAGAADEAQDEDGFEDLGADPKDQQPRIVKGAKRKANRVVKSAEHKGDVAHQKLHHAKRKAGEVAEEARVGANAAVRKAGHKIDVMNDQAKKTGEHLKEHAKFGERKAGDIVDECKDMAKTAEEHAEQRARVADLEGHHNHAEFQSATAHAMFHLREGLEMARKIALDAKNQLIGPPPATGGAEPLLPESNPAS